MNFDGATNGSPGPAGGGGVFRDSQSLVSGFYSINVGIVYAFEAKLLTTVFAIEKAKALVWFLIWMECEFSSVVMLS